MREIIVDRETEAKAFVLFELTKGNIAEIKDRYILGQLHSAIDSPWSTALPVGIRTALAHSVSEELEDRFLLDSMDKDTDLGVKSAIKNAAIIWIDCSAVELGRIVNRHAKRIEFDIVMETGPIAVTVDDERMVPMAWLVLDDHCNAIGKLKAVIVGCRLLRVHLTGIDGTLEIHPPGQIMTVFIVLAIIGVRYGLGFIHV